LIKDLNLKRINLDFMIIYLLAYWCMNSGKEFSLLISLQEGNPLLMSMRESDTIGKLKNKIL